MKNILLGIVCFLLSSSTFADVDLSRNECYQSYLKHSNADVFEKCVRDEVSRHSTPSGASSTCGFSTTTKTGSYYRNAFEDAYYEATMPVGTCQKISNTQSIVACKKAALNLGYDCFQMGQYSEYWYGAFQRHDRAAVVCYGCVR